MDILSIGVAATIAGMDGPTDIADSSVFFVGGYFEMSGTKQLFCSGKQGGRWIKENALGIPNQLLRRIDENRTARLINAAVSSTKEAFQVTLIRDR